MFGNRHYALPAVWRKVLICLRLIFGMAGVCAIWVQKLRLTGTFLVFEVLRASAFGRVVFTAANELRLIYICACSRSSFRAADELHQAAEGISSRLGYGSDFACSVSA